MTQLHPGDILIRPESFTIAIVISPKTYLYIDLYDNRFFVNPVTTNIPRGCMTSYPQHIVNVPPYYYINDKLIIL